MKTLSKQQIILLHEHMIQETGGAHGLRDEGMLDSALAHTSDSLDYYDYYVELTRFFCMQQPDSVVPCSERILRFTERQKATPRVNGLKAEAYLLRAAYNYNFRQKYDEAIADNINISCKAR